MLSNKAGNQHTGSMMTSAQVLSNEEISTIVTRNLVPVPEMQSNFDTIYSPIQTQSPTRQMGVSSLLTQNGTQMIYTTPQFACVPVGMSTQSMVPLPTVTAVTTTATPTSNVEQRYIHLGASARTPDSDDNVLRLRAEIMRLRNKYERDESTSRSVELVQSEVSSTPSINVQQQVSSSQQQSAEPVFPRPNLRTYAEHEKLRGRENFVNWRRMVVRDLRMMNLAPFIETRLGSNTTWSELSRIHGDALAQRSLLSSVSSLIEAQIQFCSAARDMWTYISDSYSDLAQLQFLSVVTEVEMLSLTDGTSVHEVFDKLMALRLAAAELGDDMPERYWVIQATRIIYDAYPRETFEALQQTPTTLCSMRRHFRNVVRESPIAVAPMFPAALPMATTGVASGLRPMFPTSPLRTRMYTVAQSRKNFPHLFRKKEQSSLVTPGTHTGQIELTKEESQPHQMQVASMGVQTPLNFPHRPIEWTPDSMLEQPRYPPPGSYIQTIRAAGKRVCYSCGITGHGAEFCPNMNMPVCYGCKEIGHKRPQCTKQWAWEQRRSGGTGVTTQLQQQVSSVNVPPQAAVVAPKATGTIFTFTTTSTSIAHSNLFLLDTGATHHVVSNPKLLIDFIPKPHTQSVYLADKIRSLSVLCRGTLSFTVTSPSGTDDNLVLSDVLVCPDVTINIISVRSLCSENNLLVLFTADSASIFRKSSQCDGLVSELNIDTSSRTRTAKTEESPNVRIYSKEEVPRESPVDPSSILFKLTKVRELYSFIAFSRYFPNKYFILNSLTCTSQSTASQIVVNVIAEQPPTIQVPERENSSKTNFQSQIFEKHMVEDDCRGVRV